MLKETKIIVSPHARERFRERIKTKGTIPDITDAIRRAKPPGGKKKKEIYQDYIEATGRKLVLKEEQWLVYDPNTKGVYLCYWKKAGILVVLTCWATEPKPKPLTNTIKVKEPINITIQEPIRIVQGFVKL